MAFRTCEFLPGVHHIEDALGVCMTLLVGRERALLVDTGYGLEDVAAFARSITPLPVTVMLTHGHHDHALGARWFRRVELLPEDTAVYALYTDVPQRRRVLESARSRGIPVDEKGYLAASMAEAEPLGTGEMDLGGLTARVIPCPGHTPGSAVVYVPEQHLLLTGDDWNPCTWLFFPEALPVRDYLKNVRGLTQLPFEWVLCSHRFELFPRKMMTDFLDGLTEQVLRSARPVDTGADKGIPTAEAALPSGQVLVFDRDKLERGEKT